MVVTISSRVKLASDTIFRPSRSDEAFRYIRCVFQAGSLVFRAFVMGNPAALSIMVVGWVPEAKNLRSNPLILEYNMQGALHGYVIIKGARRNGKE